VIVAVITAAVAVVAFAVVAIDAVASIVAPIAVVVAADWYDAAGYEQSRADRRQRKSVFHDFSLSGSTGYGGALQTSVGLARGRLSGDSDRSFARMGRAPWPLTS
jgi:hypothetical protein